MFLNDHLRGEFDGWRSAFGEGGADFAGEALEAKEKFSPCQDRCRGDGYVRFGFRSLFQYDLSSFFLQHTENQPLVSELIGDGSLAMHLCEQGFQRLGMAPGEQAVQIFDLGVEFVVLLWPDRDDAVRANGLDVGGHLKNPPIRNVLAVPDLHEPEFPLGRAVDKDGGDDEGAEVITLPGFVDADAFNRVAVV